MAPAATARSPWILSPAADALLIIGMPLLCLGLLPLARLFSSATVWTAVMGFGAVGHHLPGFLRTYGDRELFRRFAARFVLAPPLLLGVALYCSFRDLHAMALVSLTFSLWHGMMQHYGFLRIYDAKARTDDGPIDRGTARLDFAISAAWFAACLVWSPNETGSLLEALYQTGFGPLPPSVYRAVAWTVALAAAAVAIAYVVHPLLAWRRGRPPSPLKLALLVTTSGLVWFARVVTRDQFLSAALFEVLHDVQYLAIVWAFNRRLVEKGAGGVTRLLFRPGAARLLLYVGLCLGYGALSLAAARFIVDATFKRIVVALFVTSGILHFYYDGFIWKVRQPETRKGLDLEPAAAPAPTEKRKRKRAPPPEPTPRRSWLSARGLLQPAYFAIPLGLFVAVERLGGAWQPLPMARAMAAVAPDSALVENRLGAALLSSGDRRGARTHLERALALSPDFAEAEKNLGAELLDGGGADAAAAHLARAVAIDPTLVEAEVLLGDALKRQGRLAEAAERYRGAIARGADEARVHNNLGNVLLDLRRDDEAHLELEAALARAPRSAAIHLNLGVLLDRMGRTRDALPHLREAALLDPASAAAETDLGGALAKLGRTDEAVPHFQQALRLDPGFAPARDSLARVAAAGGLR